MPLLERGPERFVQRLFRKIEIAEQPDQGGENAPRFGAINRIDRSGDVIARIARHGGIVLSGAALQRNLWFGLEKHDVCPTHAYYNRRWRAVCPGGAQSPTHSLTEPAQRVHRVSNRSRLVLQN